MAGEEVGRNQCAEQAGDQDADEQRAADIARQHTKSVGKNLFPTLCFRGWIAGGTVFVGAFAADVFCMRGEGLNSGAANDSGDEGDQGAEDGEQRAEQPPGGGDAVHAGLWRRGEERDGRAAGCPVFAQRGGDGNDAAGAEWNRHAEQGGFYNLPQAAFTEVVLNEADRNKSTQYSGHEKSEQEIGGHNCHDSPRFQEYADDRFHGGSFF